MRVPGFGSRLISALFCELYSIGVLIQFAKMTVIYIDKRNIILAVTALTGSFVIGILIGTFGISSPTANSGSNSNNHLQNGARLNDFWFFLFSIFKSYLAT